MNECISNINFVLAELLSCYDIRLKEELYKITKIYDYSIDYLRNKLFKLRNKFKNNEIKMLHLGKLDWIDLNIIIIKYNKNIYNNLDIIKIYKYKRIVTADEIIDFILLPKNLEDLIISKLDKKNAEIILYGSHDFRSFQCNCDNSFKISNSKSRSEKLLDVMLYSRLEENPLVSLRELSKFNINNKISIKFKFKKINKRYKELSKNRILGRIISLCTGYGSYVMYLRDFSLFESSILSRYFIATEFVKAGNEAFVIAYCSKFNNLNILLRDIYRSGNIMSYNKILSVKSYGIPFNFYNPIDGWTLTKQNVYSVTRKLGLIA